MMNIVPTKPPLTSIQRSGETFSPRVVDARSVMISGVIITMAVNSPTGRYRRLRKASRLLVMMSRPRST